MKRRGCLLLAVILLGVGLWALMTSDWLLRYRYPKQHEQLVIKYAQAYKLDENFVYAVIYAESNFDQEAVSHAGAMGLMQIMPETAYWLSEKLTIDSFEEDDLFDPETNIMMGCYYLRFLSDRLDDNKQVLAAYNAGLSNVRQWLEDERYSKDGQLILIPIDETEHYVEKTLEAYNKYEELYP